MDLVVFGIETVEPRVGAYVPREAIFGAAAEQDGKCETFGRQVVTGKPAVGDLARPCKPFSAAGTVAYETTDKIPGFDQPYRGSGPARVERVGDLAHGLEVDLRE